MAKRKGRKGTKKTKEKVSKENEEIKTPVEEIISGKFGLGADISNITADEIKEGKEEEKVKMKATVPKKLTKKMLSDENDNNEITFRLWILAYKPLHNVLMKMKTSLKDPSYDKVYKKIELDELYNNLSE